MRDSGFDGSLGEGKTKALPPRGWRAMTACAASLSQTMRGPVLAAACCASCDTRLTAVMHRSQTPLSTWFWGTHLVADQGPVRDAVPAPVVALRDCLRYPAQAPCRDGRDRGARVPCRSRRDLDRGPYARRRPWRPPQDAGGRPAQEARNRAGQAQGRPLRVSGSRSWTTAARLRRIRRRAPRSSPTIGPTMPTSRGYGHRRIFDAKLLI